MATVTGSAEEIQSVRGRAQGLWGILFAPITILVLLFVLPMIIMVQMSLVRFPPDTGTGYTITHYVDVLTNSVNWRIALTTVIISSSAMVVMLIIAIPLSYYMVFRAGKWELIILLGLVLADELAPVVRVYAWQVLLGREGIVNWLLQAIGLTNQPLTWLLFSKFSVIVALSATFITYTTIPIYAAMKAIKPSTLEAAVDLGAGWWTKTRRILLPLAAPGIFVAMILVYIPMFTDFVTPELVGGTGSFMLGQRTANLIIQSADWGQGGAMNFLLLAVALLFAVVAYRLAKLNQLETAVGVPGR